MALDKVKSGSFNMVDIYLESLTPRIEEQWKKIGKTPKKKEMEMISDEELKEEFDKAKKAQKQYEDTNPKEAKKNADKQEETQKKTVDLSPLKLKNGVTVNAPLELVDSINTMDEPTFKEHVNDEENVFADWLEKADKELAKKLREAKTKEDTIIVIEDFLYK